MIGAEEFVFVASLFSGTQIDVNNLEPEEIWLKLVNNNVDIDYLEAIDRLLYCN